MTYKEIAKNLKIFVSTVGDICRRFDNEGTYNRKIGSGRKKVLTEAGCNIILTKIKKILKHHQKNWLKLWNTKLLLDLSEETLTIMDYLEGLLLKNHY